MNNSGLDDSTQYVNRSANISQSPVPKRPESDQSHLGTSIDADRAAKQKAEEESITKKILRNKMKEIEEAGYPNKDKRTSVEPAANESRQYGARTGNTSYTNTSGYNPTATSTLRETMKSSCWDLHRRGPFAEHERAAGSHD